jgi:transposase
MCEPPGIAEPLEHYLREGRRKGGRPEDPKKGEKLARALVLRKKGTSYQDIAKAIDVSKATITNWFKEHDEAQKEREEAQKEAAV